MEAGAIRNGALEKLNRAVDDIARLDATNSESHRHIYQRLHENDMAITKVESAVEHLTDDMRELTDAVKDAVGFAEDRHSKTVRWFIGLILSIVVLSASIVALAVNLAQS